MLLECQGLTAYQREAVCLMCDKVWKDYLKRGVYNQDWIHPTGDICGLVTLGRRLRRGFAEPAVLKRGAEVPCHSALFHPLPMTSL